MARPSTLNNNWNIEYVKVKNVKMQNRKTGFGSIKKPVFGFAKTTGFTGYPVSVKTGLQTLLPISVLALFFLD
jgi:hypothetical protein